MENILMIMILWNIQLLESIPFAIKLHSYYWIFLKRLYLINKTHKKEKRKICSNKKNKKLKVYGKTNNLKFFYLNFTKVERSVALNIITCILLDISMCRVCYWILSFSNAFQRCYSSYFILRTIKQEYFPFNCFCFLFSGKSVEFQKETFE